MHCSHDYAARDVFCCTATWGCFLSPGTPASMPGNVATMQYGGNTCSGIPEQAGTDRICSHHRETPLSPPRPGAQHSSACAPVTQLKVSLSVDTAWGACTENTAQKLNVFYFHNSLPTKAASKLGDLINYCLSFLCVMFSKFNSICKTAIQEQINPNLWKATWSL